MMLPLKPFCNAVGVFRSMQQLLFIIFCIDKGHCDIITEHQQNICIAYMRIVALQYKTGLSKFILAIILIIFHILCDHFADRLILPL
jgi:hypothetical protein